MGNLLQSINALVPFADPTRPLWQDAIYSILLCTFLYIAPLIPFAQIWQNGLSKIQIPTHRNATHPIEPPQPAPFGNQAAARQATVENDDSDSDSDTESLTDADLAALIRDAEARGALANPFADGDPGPANPQQAHGPQQLVPDFGAGAGAGAGQVGAEGAPGQHRRLRDPNRPVGAKKAKSLARRERVRAYNEFMREQGDMQRAQEASVANVRDAALAEARERRQKAEREIEERERRRREEKRLREEEQERQERSVVERTVEHVRSGLERDGRIEITAMAKAVGRDEAWVERLVRREGMLGVRVAEKERVLTIVTGKGWIVRVAESDLQSLLDEAASYQGVSPSKLTWSETGSLLDSILRRQRVHS